MHNGLTERHSHLPLAYLLPKMLSGFVQILSHFTRATESVPAHSCLTENLEEQVKTKKTKWSRRGCESDSQTESATTIPCGRNPQERASCCQGISPPLPKPEQFPVFSHGIKTRKGLSWCHSTQMGEWGHHRGKRWRGRGSWGEKLSRHSVKCSWRHTEGTTSVKLEDIWDSQGTQKE